VLSLRLFFNHRPLRVGTAGHSFAMSPVWKIDGKYYDLQEFAKVHPGGAYAVSLSADHDCTDLFYSYHRAAALVQVKRFQIAPPAQGAARLRGEPSEGDAAPDPRMAKLRARIEARCGVRSLRELTTPWIGVVTDVILGAAYVCAAALWFIHPTLANAVATGVLGWIFAGFIQHEACHSALSRKQWINHVGRFAIVPYADPRTWFVKHVVDHHPYTNTRADGDFMTEHQEVPVMAHHGSLERGPLTQYQLYLQLVGGTMVAFFYSAADVLKVLTMRKPEWQESALYLLLTAMWFGIHYMLHGSIFWCVIPHFAFGICFSNITQWNHIQEEATTEVLLDAPRPGSFISHQASACIDCAHDSALWSLLTIFLNFQTFHHILPNISHHHFLWNHQVRTAILEFLKEEGIPLTMMNPLECALSHYSWLTKVGAAAAAVGRQVCDDVKDSKKKRKRDKMMEIIRSVY